MIDLSFIYCFSNLNSDSNQPNENEVKLYHDVAIENALHGSDNDGKMDSASEEAKQVVKSSNQPNKNEIKLDHDVANENELHGSDNDSESDSANEDDKQDVKSFGKNFILGLLIRYVHSIRSIPFVMETAARITAAAMQT